MSSPEIYSRSGVLFIENTIRLFVCDEKRQVVAHIEVLDGAYHIKAPDGTALSSVAYGSVQEAQNAVIKIRQLVLQKELKEKETARLIDELKTIRGRKKGLMRRFFKL